MNEQALRHRINSLEMEMLQIEKRLEVIMQMFELILDNSPELKRVIVEKTNLKNINDKYALLNNPVVGNI